MKTITIRQFASVKRVAQNVNPLVTKKQKLMEKIKDLTSEISLLSQEIEGHEMGIKAITGGYTSEDLVIKKVEDTGKFDKNNKSVKVTKYEPNPAIIVLNSDKGIYEIKEDTKDIENTITEKTEKNAEDSSRSEVSYISNDYSGSETED